MRLRLENFSQDFETLLEDNRSFYLKMSKTSTELVLTDLEKPKKNFYSNHRINFKVFHLSKKIKKELTPLISEMNDFMRNKEFDYYLSNDYIGDFCTREVYNIDINSAYLSVLQNEGFLSKELHNEIYNLEKKDRLICLGLLAYEPTYYYFKDGNKIPYDSKVVKNDFKNFFLFCVWKTSEVLREVKKVLGNDFIFSWVDGVYFQSVEFLKDIVINEFKANGLAVSFEVLKNFTHVLKKETHHFIYEKEGKTVSMNVPTDYKTKRKRKDQHYINYIRNPNFENANKFFNLQT